MPQLSNPTAAWDQLTTQVDALVAAWQSSDDPPDLADFLPANDAALRKLLLVELIKVDLEYRWLHKQLPRTIEEYVQAFPELATDGVLPCDLIHEEFHIRKQAGNLQSPAELFLRFPQQADQLRRVLNLQSADVTTALVPGGLATEIEVGQQIDDFDLLTRLGRGAFASVFLARQRSMQRLVALKISKDRGTEPQTLAQLDHPHIVRVYDQRLLPDRQLRLMYMQHVPGGTLLPIVERVRLVPLANRSGKLLFEAIDEALVQRGDFPPTDSPLRHRLARSGWSEAVCWIGARLATALDYAHGLGVLHRDVKPANVLLCADGSPKLADFNVSFSSKLEGATAADFFGGSLAYMSPEQLEACDPDHARRPDQLDGRSDIYSLGVMLWELLTGHRPFADDAFNGDIINTRRKMLDRRRAGPDAGALALLAPDLCSGMNELLLSCLSPDVEKRPWSAGALARQMELCLQPKVQRLLRPKRGGLRSQLRSRPILTFCTAAIAPNVVMSTLAITYNFEDIVKGLNAADTNLFLTVQLSIVNVAAYSLGIVSGLWLSSPVLKAVRAANRGERIESSRLPALRSRALALGDYLFWISLSLWVVTGLMFPAWLQAAGGEKTAVEARHYWHFFFSQLLCGMIASTQAFFLVTLVSVRGCCPALVRQDRIEPEGVYDLARLSRRVWVYFGLAVATVPLALMLLALIDTDLKLAVVISCAVGLAGIYLAFRLLRAIHSDLTALAAIMSPANQAEYGEQHALESLFKSRPIRR